MPTCTRSAAATLPAGARQCFERKGSGARTVHNEAVMAAFDAAVERSPTGKGTRGIPAASPAAGGGGTNSKMLGAMTSIPGGMGVEELNESMLESASPGNGVAPSAE